MNFASLLLDKIVENILTKIHYCSEVGFATPNFCYLFDKIDQVMIVGEHESINEDAGSTTNSNLLQSFLNYHGIQSHRIFIEQPAIGGRFGIATRALLGLVLDLPLA